MKFLAYVIAVSTVGTCAVGDTAQVPPSQSEQKVAEQTSPPSDATTQKADPWAGLPQECRELGSECPDCDEVARMRRQIEFKKCMPVCEAYLEKSETVATLPAEGIAQLQTKDACGKEKTSCSPIEQKRCELAVEYATIGDDFRAAWADREQTPIDDLSGRLRAELLDGYLDHHQRLIDWAKTNGVDPAAVIAIGGELLRIESSDLIRDVTAELAARGDRALPVVTALLDLARYPGDPATFAERRKSALER